VRLQFVRIRFGSGDTVGWYCIFQYGTTTTQTTASTILPPNQGWLLVACCVALAWPYGFGYRTADVHAVSSAPSHSKYQLHFNFPTDSSPNCSNKKGTSRLPFNSIKFSSSHWNHQLQTFDLQSESSLHSIRPQWPIALHNFPSPRVRSHRPK
jgi:hypothetical protein